MKKHADPSNPVEAALQQKQALPAFIGSVDAAKLLGMSQDTLERLVADGRITKITAGTFDIVQLIREFVAYKGGIGARSEVEKQKAIKLLRENRTANRELITVADHTEDINRLFIVFRTWLKALPGRIASTGANTEPAVLRELVRVECARVKDELGDVLAGKSESDPVEPGPDGETDTHSGHLGSAN